jgi:hypothetical protein
MQFNTNIIDKLKKWEGNGFQVLSNGTILLCKVPHIAPQAWFHRLYTKLPQEKIFQLENKLTNSIPEDLKDFLSNFNGLNIFSDSLSIWGVKTSRGISTLRFI